MGVISFVKQTPDALKQTLNDIKASPIEGIFVKGTGRLWNRLVSNVKTIGQDAKTMR